MQLEELSNISDSLAMMADPALQQFAQMHKNDPYMVSLALSESNRRKKMRTAAQGQAGGAPQPKVVDTAIQGMAPAPAPMAPPMMAQQQLPENQGIAQIPTPNMQNLADGGIAGYGDDQESMADGGMGGMFDFAQRSEPVLRMAGGGMTGYMPGFRDTGAVNAAFEAALQKTLKYEGGYVADDAGKGPSNFGINKSANPDVDIKNLTKEKARELYKKRYWDAIGGDALAAKDPALATIAFDTAVNMGVGKAKQLVDQSKGDPAAILSMRQQHYDNLIKDNPKKFAPFEKGWQSRLADLATSVIPSAQAGELPTAKAAPAPAEEGKAAFLTPSSGIGRKEGKISEAIKSGEAPRQMMLGAGDLPYNLAGGLFDISHDISKVFGNKSAPPALGSRGMKDFATKYLGREPDPTDPTLKGFRTAGELGSMVIDPLSTTRKVAKSAEGLEALAAAQRAKVAETEAKAAQTQQLRLEPPSAPQTIVADMQGNAVLPTGLSAETRARQQLEAQDIAQKALADRAARSVEAGRLAQTEKQLGEIPSLTQRAEMERLATMSDRARGAGMAAKVGDAETMRNLGIITERPEMGESVSGTYDTTMPPPKAIVEAAKDVTPAKERKGFGDDDLLMLGLSLMANKSPNFMTALGEAGMQTLGAKREREKGESEKEYRQALMEQAKRPSSEVQLIEKYRDDPKFREAYEMFAASKREPMTREKLMGIWSTNPYLQMQYKTPEEYIKIMEPANSGGASGSQLSASDKSLIQQYILR
jgi:hypothetical protein